MTLLVLILAFVIETLWGQIHSLRKHTLLLRYHHFIEKLVGSHSDLNPWLIVSVILFPPLLLLALLLGNSEGLIGFLFEWCIATAIVVWCSGPISLEMKKSECQLDDNAGEVLLIYAHRGYFSVIIWFLLAGPTGILCYRLIEVFSQNSEEENETLRPLWQQLFNLVDWIPSRISALAFLLTGNFASGFSSLKEGLFQFNSTNDHWLANVGKHSLKGAGEEAELGLTDFLGLIERSMVVLLVVVALLVVASL